MSNPLKIFYFCLILIIHSSISDLPAQELSKKWTLIKEAGDKAIYIDTATIKLISNRISVWSLTVLKDPIKIELTDQEANQVKTQYLFNKVRKRYSEIGRLYYDYSGRMVGESNLARVGLGSDNFSRAIPENSDIETIFNLSVTYLSKGDIPEPEKPEEEPVIEENYKDTSDETNNNFIDEPTVPINVEPEISLEDNGSEDEENDQEVESIQQNQAETDFTETKSYYEAPIIEEPQPEKSVRIIDPESGKYFEIIDDSEDDEEITPEPVEEVFEEPEPESPVYDQAKEKNVTNTIFSDGQLFCFQVSSWKTKSIAIREMEKLQKKGFNAFLQEANPRNKRGTWYRVRVGYFNSLEEAKENQRKIR